MSLAIMWQVAWNPVSNRVMQLPQAHVISRTWESVQDSIRGKGGSMLITFQGGEGVV